MPIKTKTKVFYNPKCSKCRTAVCELEKAGEELEIIEYLKTPPTAKELKQILVKLHIKPKELVRTTEELYKKNFADKKFSDEEWVQIMIENPILIQRPIIIKGTKAVVGRSQETIDDILKK